MDDVTDLARDLVAIPSHEDPGPIADRIVDWLVAETPARVVRSEEGNVFASWPTANPGLAEDTTPPSPHLALVGHHDVVPPADDQVADDGRYRTEVRDGRLHGRGAADMKGALAAALVAFRDAIEAVGDGAGNPTQDADADANAIGCASFVGEERGGIGAQAAIDAGYAPDRAVVIEGSTGYSAPGVTDVAVAHRGRRESRIVASGTAAHAAESNPDSNALYRAAEALAAIRDLPCPEASVPVLSERTLRGSITPTTISGGEAPNVAPARCTVTIDERTVPGSAARVALDAVERIDGVRIETESEHPAMACHDGSFVKRTLDAVRSVQDGDGERVVKPHATDAGWLAKAGTACLVIGPSEPGEAHTDDESVSLDALDRCRSIDERLLTDCLPS